MGVYPRTRKPVHCGCDLPFSDGVLSYRTSRVDTVMDTRVHVSRVHRPMTLARGSAGSTEARSIGNAGIPGDTGWLEEKEEQFMGRYYTPHTAVVGLMPPLSTPHRPLSLSGFSFTLAVRSQKTLQAMLDLPSIGLEATGNQCTQLGLRLFQFSV